MDEFKRMQELAGITLINESYQNKLHSLLGDVGSDEEIELYIDSLNNDPSQVGYEDYTDQDFIEDFNNFIADKSL